MGDRHAVHGQVKSGEKSLRQIHAWVDEPRGDRAKQQLTQANLTQMAGPPVEWRISPPDSGAPVLPMGAPILPMGAPILPMGAPILPANHMPMSTWGLGQALKLAMDAGVPKIAVIHFNNCFNMAVEVMHTVAPYADYAAGYANSNFFTAGQSYPAVFQRLRSASAPPADGAGA